MIRYQDMSISKLSDYLSGDNSLHIKAQVAKVSPPQTLSYNVLQVQDMFVAQGSHKIQVTLWNDLVSQVSMNQCILVTNVQIRLTDSPHITTTSNTEISTIDEVTVDASKLNQSISMMNFWKVVYLERLSQSHPVTFSSNVPLAKLLSMNLHLFPSWSTVKTVNHKPQRNMYPRCND